MKDSAIPQVLEKNYWIAPENSKTKKNSLQTKFHNDTAILIVSVVSKYFSKELAAVSDNKFVEFQKSIETILKVNS